MEAVTKTIKVLRAEYCKDAESIVILGECSEGTIRTQMMKSAFDPKGRGPDEMDLEMEKIAHLLIGKKINIVFDPELDKKIKAGQRLVY